MRRLTNQARVRAGLAPLHAEASLGRSARRKSLDILRCDSFSHTACGHDFTFWIRHFGYPSGGCWSAGENIAWGTGPLGTPRSIFSSWMHSPGHRANILDPDFEDFGVGLKVGRLEGNQGAHVWTQDFGARC